MLEEEAKRGFGKRCVTMGSPWALKGGERCPATLLLKAGEAGVASNGCSSDAGLVEKLGLAELGVSPCAEKSELRPDQQIDALMRR